MPAPSPKERENVAAWLVVCLASVLRRFSSIGVSVSWKHYFLWPNNCFKSAIHNSQSEITYRPMLL